jgi:hypothetical protein
MIARHEEPMDKHDVWSKLAAPLPNGVVSWRQDGKAIMRDGRWLARFVAYIEAGFVRERLDGVVPGEWDLSLELLPPLVGFGGEQDEASACAFKARLQILGVIREDVGTGRDYKSAATDAFKRVAVRYGVGHELYAYEMNWVHVDGDSRYAKPLEDPQTAYNRRYAGKPGVAGIGGGVAAAERERVEGERAQSVAAQESNAAPRAAQVTASTVDRSHVPAGADNNSAPVVASAAGDANQECPKCGGRMWDNRVGKRNPKAPDFKCRDRSCDGVIWPPKGARPAARSNEPEPVSYDSPSMVTGTDDIPF